MTEIFNYFYNYNKKNKNIDSNDNDDNNININSDNNDSNKIVINKNDNFDNYLNNEYALINSTINLERLKKELKEGVDFKIKKFEDEFKIDEKILNNINEELKKGVDWEMEHFKNSLNTLIENKYLGFDNKSFITGLVSGSLLSLSVIYISLKLFKH